MAIFASFHLVRLPLQLLRQVSPDLVREYSALDEKMPVLRETLLFCYLFILGNPSRGLRDPPAMSLRPF